MNRKVRMYSLNKDKKVIYQDVEERLASVYKNMGWTLEEPKKEEKNNMRLSSNNETILSNESKK